jgi:hypothetical protein
MTTKQVTKLLEQASILVTVTCQCCSADSSTRHSLCMRFDSIPKRHEILERIKGARWIVTANWSKQSGYTEACAALPCVALATKSHKSRSNYIKAQR